MLKKTDAFQLSPGLPIRRMAGLLFPVILLLSLMIACQEPVQPEPYPDSDLLLEQRDVSCTEAWLKVSLSGTDSGAVTAIPVILTRDGETLNSFSFTPPETLIIDTGLEPAQSYQYQAQRQSVHDNKIIASSNILSVTTLDTTSHDFSWTIDTLGDYGSYLNDVAIIDENNIWAVGMIETDSGSYNAAHWNGDTWKLVLIDRIVDFDGVFAFNANDVWFSDGCFIYRYDGTKFEKQWECDWQTYGPGQANAIWGSSPEDVWFVGSSGSIVHYDGSNFTRLESGTDQHFLDVYGATNSITQENEVLAVAGGLSVPLTGPQLYRLKTNQAISLPDSALPWVLYGIWFIPDRAYYISGSGLFFKYSPDYEWEAALPTASSRTSVRGNAINDVMVTGPFMSITHYNGYTWHQYFGNRDGLFKQVEIQGDLAVAVGYYGANALIAMGRR